MSDSREETPKVKPFEYKTVEQLLPGFEYNPNTPSPFTPEEQADLRKELEANRRRQEEDWAELANQFVGHEQPPRR